MKICKQSLLYVTIPNNFLTVIWFQVFLSNTINSYKSTWFQGGVLCIMEMVTIVQILDKMNSSISNNLV